MMMSMISAGGRAVFVFLRGRLFQGKILTRQTTCKISIKSSHYSQFRIYDAYISYTHCVFVCVRIYIYVYMYSSKSRQEEPRDTGVTLSNNGSICCLHPAAFCYFLSPYIIVLTSTEKVFLPRSRKSIAHFSWKKIHCQFFHSI